MFSVQALAARRVFFVLEWVICIEGRVFCLLANHANPFQVVVLESIIGIRRGRASRVGCATQEFIVESLALRRIMYGDAGAHDIAGVVRSIYMLQAGCRFD